MEELIVRIHSLLNRNEIILDDDLIEIGNYKFNRLQQQLVYQNTIQNLTNRECELLYCLHQNKNKIIERSIILNLLWGNEDFYHPKYGCIYYKTQEKIRQSQFN